MTILSSPDYQPDPERQASLPSLPDSDSGPVFAEPWQAQAFALAVKLSEQGCFTGSEWATALADELKSAVERGEPDDGSHYYDHWLAALEGLVTAKALLSAGELRQRKAAWAYAYGHTPHGKVVTLQERYDRHRSPAQLTPAGGPVGAPSLTVSDAILR